MALESPLAASEGVDMSAASIAHRLMELAEMSSVCLELVTLGRDELDDAKHVVPTNGASVGGRR